MNTGTSFETISVCRQMSLQCIVIKLEFIGYIVMRNPHIFNQVNIPIKPEHLSDLLTQNISRYDATCLHSCCTRTIVRRAFTIISEVPRLPSQIEIVRMRTIPPCYRPRTEKVKTENTTLKTIFTLLSIWYFTALQFTFILSTVVGFFTMIPHLQIRID